MLLRSREGGQRCQTSKKYNEKWGNLGVKHGSVRRINIGELGGPVQLK
jgi:hypothetical protein